MTDGQLLVLKAEMFARGAHAGQKHGTKPFWKHPRSVVSCLRQITGGTDSALMAAGWLHDTIEDTPVTYQDIKTLFGVEVAELVWAVTDEMGRNRKERTSRTWPKTIETAKGTLLKLADLGANVEASIANQASDPHPLEMYESEWPEIQKHFVAALAKHDLFGPPAGLLQDLSRLMGAG